MNDRFRFRVWVKTADSYISEKDEADIVHLEEDGKIVVGLYNGDLEDMMYLKEEDLIVEQCTGLKDKNGNLIYEGDIVENGVHNNLVEWFKGGFWINGFTNGAKWNIHIVHNSLTVIGNIHENPELLEDK